MKETITQIAHELNKEIPDSNIGISFIASILRFKIGDLNNLLFTCFTVNQNTGEVLDENNKGMENIEKSILKKLFYIYYYDKQIINSLGVASNDAVVEISSDGSRVRKINKLSLVQEYRNVKKQEEQNLKSLVNDYRYGKSRSFQIAGNDDGDPEYELNPPRDSSVEVE